MRKDMPKRFMETRDGRRGRFPRHCKQFLATDEDGQHINNPHGMRKVHRLTPKCPDDAGSGTDFSVLRRFLKSRVGQPWDKVYSEVCAEADARSYEGHHLREWLEYEVEQNCFVNDGEVYDQHGRKLAGYWRRGEFFVHPETGILEFVISERHRKKEPPVQTVFELDGTLYHEYDGVWFRVKMQELAKVQHTGWGGHRYMAYDDWAALGDVLLHGLSNCYPYRVVDRLKKEYGLSPGGKVWYCTWKQSANSKEIAKLKKKQAA